MSDDADSKTRGLAADHQSQPYYGTFQGVANYQPPQPLPEPVVGFPSPVPPPGVSGRPPLPPRSHHHHHHPPQHHGYQTVTGYAVVEGRPVRERRLPCCCGLGSGWVLFIMGFFLGGIPWYIGAFILLCVRVDYREKPGYVACTIASILALLAITLGVTKGTHTW